MTAQCEIPGCPHDPAIAVRDTAGGELRICRSHWQDMLLANEVLLHAVALTDSSADGHATLAVNLECFLPECESSSVNVVRDPDGTHLPVCLTHWDDLSWVRDCG